MKLNLPILPLNLIDSFNFQKCLMPKEKFPKNAKPGQWAKCYFVELWSEKQYYAVAQIFPRGDLDGVCYLDTCVSSYDCEEDRKLILQSLTVFEIRKEIKAANVIFQIKSKYFIENSSFVNKPYLHTIAKILLQKYHLTHGSLIRDSYLLDNGIYAACIEIENSCDNSAYFVTNDTIVNIENVSLNDKVCSYYQVSSDIKPFAQVHEKLDNLMRILHLQRRSKNRSLWLNLNAIIVGAVGSGKSGLAAEFLKKHRCNIFRINVTNCLKQYPGETETEMRKIFKAASDFEMKFKAKEPTVILLEEIHLFAPQPALPRGQNSEALGNYMRITAQLLTLVDGLFASRHNIMCLATTSNPDNLNELLKRPGRFENEIAIAALQEDHRRDILQMLFKNNSPNINISHMSMEAMAKKTQGYVLADLALFVQNVIQVIYTSSEKSVEDIIVDVLKKSNPSSLKGSDVTAYKTTEKFESIGGMLQLKKILEISVLAGLKRQESFKRFGLSLPKGVLLYGPPGCAKTTIAKCLATEANMTFIATSSAEIYSPYVGCAEKFISKIFQTARKNTPCLIFLDEIDSLVGRRSLGGSSNSGEVQVRILSTLLTEMDGVIAPMDQNCHIIVVAATNRPDVVDDALMRPGRFDKLIHVPAPDLLSRRSILELYKSKMPFSESIDLTSVAAQTEDYSGADICNLCNEAAIQAFQRDTNSEEILMEDFMNILKTSKPSLLRSQIDWYYQFENKYL